MYNALWRDKRLNFMANVLPIRLYGDPILKRRALPVQDFSEILKLAEDMLETMYEAKGVGLAAPQVGVSKRMFVAAEYLDESEEEGEEADYRSVQKNLYVMVNPVITQRSGMQTIQEGCLSLPSLYSEGAERDLQVKVEYQNEHGEKKMLEAEGYLAVVMQHEIDHLDGIMFFQRMPFNLKQKFLDENRDDLADFQRQARAYLKELEQKNRA
jgi:peptide deformylase